MHISQRLINREISRWIPVFGTLSTDAYAYYDTSQVAQTAIELFTTVIEIPMEETQAD